VQFDLGRGAATGLIGLAASVLERQQRRAQEISLGVPLAQTPRLEPERVELGRRQRGARDRVEPVSRQRSPGPLDLWGCDASLPEDIRQLVESLAPDVAATQPATQRRESGCGSP
jgi:hypothetical protein